MFNMGFGFFPGLFNLSFVKSYRFNDSFRILVILEPLFEIEGMKIYQQNKNKVKELSKPF
jgi:hypothetical protein